LFCFLIFLAALSFLGPVVRLFLYGSLAYGGGCLLYYCQFFFNSKLPLLLLGGPFSNTYVSVIFDDLEKTDIIVDLIEALGNESACLLASSRMPPIAV
jgi:hypothetical protein